MREMTPNRVSAWLAMTGAVLLLLSAPAFAHRVTIFASVEDGRIEGEAYFSGGGRPKDCVIEVLDSAGQKLGEARTNDGGRFVFVPKNRVDHVLMLKTDDGHAAEFTVKAGELPDTLGGAVPGISETAFAPSATTASGLPTPAANEGDRIAAAVARAVLPLREQMYRLESRTALRDILGGIGYIFGLAGVVMYMKSRGKARA